MHPIQLPEHAGTRIASNATMVRVMRAAKLTPSRFSPTLRLALAERNVDAQTMCRLSEARDSVLRLAVMRLRQPMKEALGQWERLGPKLDAADIGKPALYLIEEMGCAVMGMNRFIALLEEMVEKNAPYMETEFDAGRFNRRQQAPSYRPAGRFNLIRPNC